MCVFLLHISFQARRSGYGSLSRKNAPENVKDNSQNLAKKKAMELRKRKIRANIKRQLLKKRTDEEGDLPVFLEDHLSRNLISKLPKFLNLDDSIGGKVLSQIGKNGR